MSIHSTIVLALLAGGAGPLAAQAYGAGGSGTPPLLPRAREIALARSAAPAAVSADATILVLERGGYVVAREGTNGVTCYVGRSWPQAIEPHCFDEEGSATILRIHLREAELREQGQTREAIDATIGRELLDGRLRLPRRPVMSYMMSSAQELYNDDGEYVGPWKPHLMIYLPYATNADFGLGETPATEAAFVVDAGKPTANVVVVVAGFVDPVFDARP